MHYLVRGASSNCLTLPHLQSGPNARTLTKVCAAVLSANGLVVPPDEHKSLEESSSRAALWAFYQTYPNEVCSALAVWLKDVSA